MKVKIVKGNGVKTVEEIRAEKMETLKRNVLESCTRTIAEAQAIAAVFKPPVLRLWPCRSSVESCGI